MHVLNVLHAARWKYRTQKNRHLGTIAQFCQAMSSQLGTYWQLEKSLLNSNISSTRAHNMANVGPLTAEIGFPVCGTPAHFNRFHVLASLLQRRRSTEANQTARCLAVSWAGTLYIPFRRILPLMEFCQVHNSHYVKVLRSPILAALLHGTWAMSISQILRRSAEGSTYIQEGGHHVGHFSVFCCSGLAVVHYTGWRLCLYGVLPGHWWNCNSYRCDAHLCQWPSGDSHIHLTLH